ncbi:Na/Pi cotransporter family protein [Arenicella xantha]|uniref:Phosphate:Na+ symporter n=1 Tax=Arenicella xantha TaxID=644221 RepID=A0A395JIV4_9GAMM|nr:Na/Pi symporter [Arenicella xantha]RBP50706.1 phosphate:Na+ symporter [Arenicella xantha]
MSFIAFISGLAIFLYAMGQLESGIQQASGEGFKKWIVNRTKTPLSSASAGIFITAVLQSSSMVSLLTLAFVSAGAMSLYSGIGVVLGANLGTTITGWIVTLVGFKMDLNSLVLPLLGIGALTNLDFLKNTRIRGTGTALFGFGLLIFGLSVMKESVAGLTELVDLNEAAELAGWVYLLIGLVLAAVMQSSSAVMMMTLALLSSQAIGLVDAAALMIGADLGTTSTTILGSLGQSIVKKQLALAHVLFNVVVDISAFFLLLPLLPAWLSLVGVVDEMFGLVMFHSILNLLGLLIFLPLLAQYTRWIQRLLPVEADSRATLFEVPVEVPEAAVASLQASVMLLARDAISLNTTRVGVRVSENGLQSDEVVHRAIADQYQAIKEFESQIIHFAQRLRLSNIAQADDNAVGQLLEATRAIVYACKTLKDIQLDFNVIRGSKEGSGGHNLADAHQTFLKQFYQIYDHALDQLEMRQTGALQGRLQHGDEASNNLSSMLSTVDAELSELNVRHHQACSDLIINANRGQTAVTATISTWFNLNHEVHHHAKYMVNALTRLQRVAASR